MSEYDTYLRFLDAVKHGKIEVLEDLLADGYTVPAETGSGLYSAGYYGRLDSLQFFLDAGLDINGKTPDGGVTPLMIAAEEDHPKAVDFLLSKGANPDLKNGQGFDALKMAEKKGHDAVVEVFRQYGYSPSLHWFLSRNSRSDIRRLIANRGISSNDAHGVSILPLLIHKKFDAEVFDLIDKGGDINGLDDDGMSILHYAILRKDRALVERLLQMGARANIEGVRAVDISPLGLAIVNRLVDICRLLIEYGADTNRADPYGQTPLILAVKGDSSELVRLLLDSGARPDIGFLEGSADSGEPVGAIELARRRGDSKIIEMLLPKGT